MNTLATALLSLIAMFYCASALAGPSTICGDVDTRVPSDFKPIGRSLEEADAAGGCTATLVSKNCVITVAHCIGDVKITEFNVPASNEKGVITHSAPTDQYEIDREIAARIVRNVPGNDWLVYRLKPNLITGKSAGEVQGFYPVRFNPILLLSTDQFRISGYGAAKGCLHATQQTALGLASRKSDKNALFYRVDTMPGNSGSAIILEKTQEIIGIHSHGECSVDGGYNHGTWIANVPALSQAITQCISLDQ